MFRIRLTSTFAAIALFLLPISTGWAQGANDRVQKIIESQINAFLADDAITAYSFAAPGIKRMFPTPDVFLRMVRRGYTPVYRPQSYVFAAQREENGQIVQEVEIVGPKGRSWLATYTLQQQPDGSWKITGCFLKHLDGIAA